MVCERPQILRASGDGWAAGGDFGVFSPVDLAVCHYDELPAVVAALTKLVDALHRRVGRDVRVVDGVSYQPWSRTREVSQPRGVGGLSQLARQQGRGVLVLVQAVEHGRVLGLVRHQLSPPSSRPRDTRASTPCPR